MSTSVVGDDCVLQDDRLEEAEIGAAARTRSTAVSGSNEHHSLSYAYSTYIAHDVEEQTHWEDVCRSYRQYATFAMAQWANHQYRLHALPEEQKQFLPAALRRETAEFQQRAKLFKDAAIRNQFCLDSILRHAGQPNSQDVLHRHSSTMECLTSPCSSPHHLNQHSTDAQMSKVSSVLKSLARDWSAEGKLERDMAYVPILQEVQRYLPVPKKARKRLKTSPSSETDDWIQGELSSNDGNNSDPPRLCVPGAGVGRLACELAALGYAVQGNEFSLYMLLASDFILNSGVATPDRPIFISPYLLESRNLHAATDPLRSMPIPDVDPFDMIFSASSMVHNDCRRESQDYPDPENTDRSPESSCPSISGGDEEDPCSDSQVDFSMAAGEFVSVYGDVRQSEQWDGFVACFFMDTAPCIIDYIMVMYKCLKPGGFVFHFGPLLWHWSGPAMRPDDKTWDVYQRRYSYLDKKYIASVDLSWQDVRAIFVNVGFEIVEEKYGVHAVYTSDRRSMMNMSYHCVKFVARKKGGIPICQDEQTEDLMASTMPPQSFSSSASSETPRSMTDSPMVQNEPCTVAEAIVPDSFYSQHHEY